MARRIVFEAVVLTIALASASALGDENNPEAAASKVQEKSTNEIIHRPVSVGIFPYVTTDGGAQGKVKNNFSLNLIGWGDYLSGAEISSIGAIRKANVKGAQLSGIFNYTHGQTWGLQAGGVANWAGSIEGVQSSGVLNIAYQDVAGAQIGVVNIGGKVTGTQIGVVNIATKEMKGAQIGVVNYAGDGQLAPTIWASDTSLVNVGLKMGSKYFYGILGVGMHPADVKRLYSAMFGLGGHIDLGNLPLWIEIDAVTHKLIEEGNWNSFPNLDSVFKLRTTLGFQVVDQLSIFAGPAFNCLVSDVRDNVSFGYSFYETTNGDNNIQLSLGFTAGIQWQPKVGKLNSR